MRPQTIALLLVFVVLGLTFQNCSGTFSGFTEMGTNLARFGGGDSYDGKLQVFSSLDLSGQCLNSNSQSPRIRYRLLKNGNTYQAERGDCHFPGTTVALGQIALPPSGLVPVDPSLESIDWAHFNPRTAVVDGQIFQDMQFDSNTAIVNRVVRAPLSAFTDRETIAHIEIIKNELGDEQMRYVVGSYSMGLGPRLLLGSPISQTSVSMSSTVNPGAFALSLVGQFTSSNIILNLDLQRKLAHVQSSGDTGVSGGINIVEAKLIESDPCDSSSSTVGTVCRSGAIFAGAFGGRRLMVTPGNCTNDPNPVCDGSTDQMELTWRGTGGRDDILPGVDAVGQTQIPSTTGFSGDVNTAAIVASSDNGPDSAARYCDELRFGGFDDWFLPSKSELTHLYCLADDDSQTGMPQENPSCASYGGPQRLLPGFSTGWYWSSTQTLGGTAWNMSFLTGNIAGNIKVATSFVRCIRAF